ncbi:hypothetical protein QTN25_000333 [Entamoeba marina]
MSLPEPKKICNIFEKHDNKESVVIVGDDVGDLFAFSEENNDIDYSDSSDNEIINNEEYSSDETISYEDDESEKISVIDENNMSFSCEGSLDHSDDFDDFDYVDDHYDDDEEVESVCIHNWNFKKAVQCKFETKTFLNSKRKTDFLNFNDTEPSSIFKCFIDEEIINMMVKSTNIKAQEYTEYYEDTHINKTNYVPFEWEDVTKNEMYAFIGVLIYGGTGKMACLSFVVVSQEKGSLKYSHS